MASWFQSATFTGSALVHPALNFAAHATPQMRAAMVAPFWHQHFTIEVTEDQRQPRHLVAELSDRVLHLSHAGATVLANDVDTHIIT